MKWLVCNYSGEFGTIDVSSSDGYASAIGRMPKPNNHIGSVDILVCPNCGALHSTMRNKINMQERKSS